MTELAGIALDQPRARGAVRLDVVQRHGQTRLNGLRQSGSMRSLFPRCSGTDMQTVLINTAGGITGGDAFSTGFSVGDGATLTLTTQAAERAYKAQTGQTGRVDNQIAVGAKARVNWLPQETILFDGSALRRRLLVELDVEASALIVEPLVFGRAAMGEQVNNAVFSDHIELRRQGELLFLDRTQLRGDIAAHLAGPHLGAGAGALATVLFVHPGAGAHLSPIREIIGANGGATLLRDDVMFVRMLAADSHVLRQALIPVLTRLSANDLPRPWMI